MSATTLKPVEIRGPSALGGSWRRFLTLTWLIASTDFKLTYFGSVLGYVWSLMRPLMFFGVLYLVFAVVANFGKGVPGFPVLLLLNIVLITYFQEATGVAIPSVLAREGLVRKMHFPRLVIPLAVVLTSTFNLLINLVVVFAFMLIYGIEPRLTWLLLPVIIVPLLMLTTGVAMLLSALYVRYRDVAPMWGVVSQMLFYGSPVFYTIEALGRHHAARYYLFNPLAMLMHQARVWMIGDPHGGGVAFWMGGAVWLLVPCGILVGLVALGYWVFNREAPRIAEEL